MSTPVSDRGVAFVLAHEGFKGKPYVPSDKSGLTLDYGYDFQFHTKDQVQRDWNGLLGDAAVQRLIPACGLRGDAARAVVGACPDVRVSKASALAVFHLNSLPRYWALTRQAFPGVDFLPQSARDGLFSLVFNRGGDMGKPSDPGYPTNDRRMEMRAIRDDIATPRPNLAAIAAAVRNMKRLWVGPPTDDDGLLERREDEAAMIESEAQETPEAA